MLSFFSLLFLQSSMCVLVLASQSCLTLYDLMDYIAYQAPLSMEFSRQEHWSWLPFPSPGYPPNPEIEPGSPALQAVSLPSEPPGKSKNTGAGSLSLLQWIFPTQESNWGILHCRQILYQLSYQGSPRWRNGNNSTCQCRRHKRFNPWVGKILWRRK